MGSARFIVADVFAGLATLPDDSVDLIFSSPPFLALRSYLPAEHESKHLEIGSEATPADFLDTLLDVVEACDRVLAPHGSLCFELGDTFAGSGGAGGDYNEGGLRDGQPKADGSSSRSRGPHRCISCKQSVEDPLDHWKDSYGSAADGTWLCPLRTRTVGTREHRPPGARPDGGGGTGGQREREMVQQVPLNAGNGWPLPKSLCGIPTLFAWSLAYGRNLLRPERTTPRWRIRNVVVWARPNPPVGALGDKFRPATSYLTVACKSDRRWFDLDAVRSEHKHLESQVQNGKRATNTGGNRADDGGEFYNIGNPAGAPPLDYWEIPTQPSTSEGTSRRLRVPLDGLVGGIQRTTSADCPEHGSRDRQGSSGERGGREAAGSIRTPGSDARRVPAPQAEPPPTFWSTDQTDDDGSQSGPVAIPHSKASSRTAPDPGTTPADTPSVGTAGGTERTSGSPESSDSGSNTDESRTEDEAGSAADPQRTAPRTDHSSPSSACTCSYFVDLDVAEPTTDYAPIPGRKTGGKYAGRSNASREPGTGDRGGSAFETHEGGAPPLDYWEIPTQGYAGSHYATFPDKLVVKPIKAMCPSSVCRTCGEPRRRITQATEEYAEHLGSSWADRDDGRTKAAGTERNSHSGQPVGAHITAAQRETTGWTDCGHNDYRNGVVLDPFAGSGTTLSVATGHGRDAIGIDLDARNAELALERVGPLFLTVEHLGDTEPFSPPPEDVETEVF